MKLPKVLATLFAIYVTINLAFRRSDPARCHIQFAWMERVWRIYLGSLDRNYFQCLVLSFGSLAVCSHLRGFEDPQTYADAITSVSSVLLSGDRGQLHIRGGDNRAALDTQWYHIHRNAAPTARSRLFLGQCIYHCGPLQTATTCFTGIGEEGQSD